VAEGEFASLCHFYQPHHKLLVGDPWRLLSVT
jgi:hypothetical protein